MITHNDGWAAFKARMACGTSPRSFQASSARGDFIASGSAGNNTTAGIPSAWAPPASLTKPASDQRVQPGIEAIGWSSPPSCRKSG